MKRAIMCLVVFGYVGCLFICGQTIQCDYIDFELVPISKENTEFVDFKYQVQIEMNLSVANIKNDTLVLKTNIKAAQGLEPKNLKAFLVDDKQEKKLLPSFVKNIPGNQLFNDIQLLNILLSGHQNSNIIINYDVIGTGFFFYLLNQNYPNVVAYHPWQEYIYPMNIPIKEIRVNAPDNMLSFYSMRDNSGIHNEEVNLTFINKEAFKKESAEWGKVKLNTYIPDSIVNNITYREQIDKFYSYINKLSAYIQVPKTLNIILLLWRDEKNRNAFGKSLENHSICDIKLSDKSILHEAIHQAFPNDVLAMSEGEYFIKESIVEWLTVWLSGQLKKVDMSLIGTTNTNLYNIHINDRETWSLIYKVGPAILQKIATKCGEDKLASTIISFFLEKEGKVTNYTEFLDYLRTHAHLSENTIEELDSMVKGAPCG